MSTRLKSPSHLGVLLTLLLLLAGCGAEARPPALSADVVEAMSGGRQDGYALAVAPVPFLFPQDHGPHPAYRTEWWYYTGNLTGEGGSEFGYQLTFFRSAVAPELAERESDLATNQIYMAHFAVTDAAARQHHGFDRFSRGAGDLAGATGVPAYQVWLEDWSVEQTLEGDYRLRAAAQGEPGQVAVDLRLSETRLPVLHGDAGLSQKGPEPGNASYYYSLVGLETRGTLQVGDRAVSVTGVSWFDHEYGTSALSEDAVGWDWFSAQLDNGALLMFADVRTAQGTPQEIFQGTLVYPDGRQEVILPQDFTLTPSGEWTSPETGITYPSGWDVTFPEHDIRLTIEPLIPNQEMQVTFIYYEGATRITGFMKGEPVAGRGYVELTGYGESAGYQR